MGTQFIYAEYGSFTHLRGFESCSVLSMQKTLSGFTHLRGFESRGQDVLLLDEFSFTHLRGFESWNVYSSEQRIKSFTHLRGFESVLTIINPEGKVGFYPLTWVWIFKVLEMIGFSPDVLPTYVGLNLT